MRKRSWLLLLALCFMLVACNDKVTTSDTKPKVDNLMNLPAPEEVTPENAIDYFHRADSLYIDIRNYEEYVQGHMRNFELIPFASLIYAYEAELMPDSVQLYGGFPEAPIPLFEESDQILATLFPQDKNLFIICRSGNRSAAMIHLLVERGWDPAKLYDLGGVLDYEGNPTYEDLLVAWPMYRGVAHFAVDGLTRILR